MIKATIISLVGVAGLGYQAQASDKLPFGIMVKRGYCSKPSHIASGKIDADITSAETAIACDTIVIGKPKDKVVMVQFNGSSGLYGFSYYFDGKIKNQYELRSIYVQGVRHAPYQGYCTSEKSEIACVGVFYTDNQKTVIDVDFHFVE